MSHTKGKLVANGSVLSVENSGTICYVDNGDFHGDRDNTRRLVACWNEHDGLVHDNAQLYQSLQGEMQGRLKAEKERDELVKALRKVVDWNDKYPSHRGFSYNAIVRIAKKMDQICKGTKAL